MLVTFWPLPNGTRLLPRLLFDAPDGHNLGEAAIIFNLSRSPAEGVVITPGGAGTKHLINADVLKALGPSGFLINVARGSVVDEEALIEALQNATIAGAGLDVFASEPHVPQALWSLSQVVLTPHIASATSQTRQAMADLAFANMLAGVSGQPLLSPVPECMAMAK
jgi:phosphoglycerate dehydrogenase-like enzyme